MFVIGLTGGVACGKSTVAAILVEAGGALIDSDAIARQVVAPGQPALAEIAEAFGPGVLDAVGELDRGRLGRLVFADPAARRRLEAITHPRIRAESTRRLAELRREGRSLCVLDVPLLFEAGLHTAGIYDEVWVVAVPETTQIERLRRRDGLDEAAARARLAAQWPLADKVALADRVIDNAGSLEATRRQVRDALAQAMGEPGPA